jgi:hypothetical protein
VDFLDGVPYGEYSWISAVGIFALLGFTYWLQNRTATVRIYEPDEPEEEK